MAALWSPESGVVDAHALTESYRREAVAHGAALVLRTEVVGLVHRGRSWRVATRSARGERFDVATRRVVNAAGHGADRVAELAGISATVRFEAPAGRLPGSFPHTADARR